MEREYEDRNEGEREEFARHTNEEPHHEVENPVGRPDPTEWPDPYDTRPDPRDPDAEDEIAGEPQHTYTGSTSTSEPHPTEDPEAGDRGGHPPERDNLDQ
jgi:hypothetical protein